MSLLFIINNIQKGFDYMAIIKDITITVNGDTSRMSKDVFLYLGDGATTLLIEVIESDSIFGSFKSSNSNLITENNTKWASVCVLKANNEVVYGSNCEIVDGKIKFVIEKEFIDEIAEQGTHLLQIHLYDDETEEANRLTIPPVSLTILKPICMMGKEDGDTP